MIPSFDVRKLIALLAADDPSAADHLDLLAARLKDAAAKIRERHRDPRVNPGGMVDRIMMRVVGPDGDTRQFTDTGATP